jgi:hypothetical protein
MDSKISQKYFPKTVPSFLGNTHVTATHGDVDKLFAFLVGEAEKNGDIELIPNYPEFIVWKWDDEILAKIHVSVFATEHGTLIVDFQRLCGDNLLFLHFYRDIIYAGIANETFACSPLPVRRELYLPIEEDGEEISDDIFRILFDMCESGYRDTVVSGGHAIMALCNSNSQAIDYLARHERTMRVLQSLILPPDPQHDHILDIESITTGLIILEHLCITESFRDREGVKELTTKIAKTLLGRKGGAWKEAHRRLARIVAILR